MSDPITMAMVGAAVGGGGSLLSGKSLGKSLKNAAIGGTLGYGGGVAGQGLLGAGAAEGATTLAPEALAGTIESEMTLNPYTGSYLAKEPFLFANSANPIFTGTGSMLDKVSMGAQSLGSNMSNPFSGGLGVDNLMGAAKMASMYQPTQATPAPAGRIEAGQAPSPEGFAKFIQQYYPQYQQPKRTSLAV
jgi:hypothetical protein